MARLRTMSVSALNIKIHPHSEEKYGGLIELVHQLAGTARVYGSDRGMIGSLRKEKDGVYYGYIYRFLNINPDDPWLDLISKKAITDEDGDPLPQVADHLKPNYREIPFAFFPKQHRFIHDSWGLTPRSAKRLMEGLLRHRDIMGIYGDIDIEIESDEDVIERILAIPKLNRLDIIISKPNLGDVPDEDIEKIIFERLERQNARRLQEMWNSERGQSLEPDDTTKGMMKVAVSNGVVTGSGRNEKDLPITESTKEHPLFYSDRFDPDFKSDFMFFRELANTLMDYLKQR